MEVSGKWIFVIKLSRVPLLTFLLNCYILKLKSNHCDAANCRKRLNFNRGRKWRIDTERLREVKLKQLTLKDGVFNPVSDC